MNETIEMNIFLTKEDLTLLMENGDSPITHAKILGGAMPRIVGAINVNLYLEED